MVTNTIDVKILEIIKTYITEISKYYNIDNIILFGSFANGSNHEDSDIDIAVISPDILDTIDDGAKLLSLTWGIDTRIEPHPINTNEFKNNETPFIDEIIATGVEIQVA